MSKETERQNNSLLTLIQHLPDSVFIRPEDLPTKEGLIKAVEWYPNSSLIPILAAHLKVAPYGVTADVAFGEILRHISLSQFTQDNPSSERVLSEDYPHGMPRAMLVNRSFDLIVISSPKLQKDKGQPEAMIPFKSDLLSFAPITAFLPWAREKFLRSLTIPIPQQISPVNGSFGDEAKKSDQQRNFSPLAIFAVPENQKEEILTALTKTHFFLIPQASLAKLPSPARPLGEFVWPYGEINGHFKAAQLPLINGGGILFTEAFLYDPSDKQERKKLIAATVGHEMIHNLMSKCFPIKVKLPSGEIVDLDACLILPSFWREGLAKIMDLGFFDESGFDDLILKIFHAKQKLTVSPAENIVNFDWKPIIPSGQLLEPSNYFSYTIFTAFMCQSLSSLIRDKRRPDLNKVSLPLILDGIKTIFQTNREGVTNNQLFQIHPEERRLGLSYLENLYDSIRQSRGIPFNFQEMCRMFDSSNKEYIRSWLETFASRKQSAFISRFLL